MNEDLEVLLQELLQAFRTGELHTETDWPMFWANMAGLFLTAVIAFFTFRATVKANIASELAAKAQADAAAATKNSLDAWTAALRASAESEDRQTEALRALAGTASPAETLIRDVEWKIDRDGARGHWILRNMGPHTAHAVTIRGNTSIDEIDLFVANPDPRDVPKNDVFEFTVERSMASPPAIVVVLEWFDPLDNLHSQRFVVS